MIALDGFFEGLKRELDWHNVDKEFHEFASRQLSTVDTLLFGRVTYQMMASFWPTAANSDLMIASKMNSLPKLVFSRTLNKVEWNNSRLIKGNIAEEVSKLKKQPGKDIALFGSAAVLSTFMEENLIDEHRIMITPMILGAGNPLFKNMERRHTLKLLRIMTFKSGNVLLYYQPNKKNAAT
jgi:dihydrofolate reductase